jgi:toxin ParE1/3/4
MNIVFTRAAASDLQELAAYLSAHNAEAALAIERRLHLVLARVARWPQSAQQVVGRPGVRAVPLVRYPYIIFYRALPDAIEILHIQHTARREEEQ